VKKDATYIENGLIIKSGSSNVGSVRRQAAYGQATPWWQRFDLRNSAISNFTEGIRALRYQVIMKFLD